MCFRGESNPAIHGVIDTISDLLPRTYATLCRHSVHALGGLKPTCFARARPLHAGSVTGASEECGLASKLLTFLSVQ